MFLGDWLPRKAFLDEARAALPDVLRSWIRVRAGTPRCRRRVDRAAGGREGAALDKISDVDYIEVFRNADNFPNAAMGCVRGIAFAATASREGASASSLLRVPEWGTPDARYDHRHDSYSGVVPVVVAGFRRRGWRDAS